MSLSDVSTIVELWVGMKLYIPSKDQQAAAEHFILMIDEAALVDFSFQALDLYGHCEVLERAVRLYCEENGLTQDEDYNSMWDN